MTGRSTTVSNESSEHEDNETDAERIVSDGLDEPGYKRHFEPDNEDDAEKIEADGLD